MTLLVTRTFMCFGVDLMLQHPNLMTVKNFQTT